MVWCSFLALAGLSVSLGTARQESPSPSVPAAPASRERLVVATFDEQGVPAGMGDVVADMIIRAVDAPGFELLERRQVRRVLEEQAFATSDLTQPGEAVRYGRLADTRFVLVGTVYRLDGVYLVSARMVDSETGVVRESSRAVVQFRTVDEMAAKVGELARLLGLRVGPLLAGEPPGGQAAPTPVPGPAVPESPAPASAATTTVRDLLERVGDSGPASAPVSVSTPARAIRAGSSVPLRILCERDGFLSLFVVDASGGVRLLLPNARSPRFPVRAGQSVSVPGDLPFTLRAAPPFGVTRIKAIVTRDPIALSGGEEAGELLRRVSLTDAVAESGAASWSAGELEFVVVPADGSAILAAAASPAPSSVPAPGPDASVPAAPVSAEVLPAARALEVVSSTLDAVIGSGRAPDERARTVLRWPLRSVFEPAVDIAWSADGVAVAGLPLIGVIDADFDPDDPTLERAFAGMDDGTRASLREEIRRNGRPGFRHGNRVASLIAGESPWLPSVLPGARIMPVRITTTIDAPAYRADKGRAPELIAALRTALLSGCRIVNVSLHVPLSGTERNAFVADPIWEDLERAGVLVVCAAGNGREDLDATPLYPACIERPNILCVGAVGPDGTLASWGDSGSARGARSVDLVAPGTALACSDGGGRAAIGGGTSYACALATGAAARLMAAEPQLGPAGVIERLVGDSRPLPGLSGPVRACRGGLLTWPVAR
jgi:hypothetical protein